MLNKDKFDKTAFGVEIDPLANASSSIVGTFTFPQPTILNSFSVDSLIKTALSGLGFPVWNSSKPGNEEADQSEEPAIYFTFNYSTIGVGYADDEPTGELYLIQVHLHAPLSTNLTRLIRKTKSAIHGAGFTWPEMTDDTDEVRRHKIFEFQFVDGVDFDGDLYM